MALKTHGITNDTINNIMLNAGVFYKNLTYSGGDWTGTVVGATSGGGKYITGRKAIAEAKAAEEAARKAEKAAAKRNVKKRAGIRKNKAQLYNRIISYSDQKKRSKLLSARKNPVEKSEP